MASTLEIVMRRHNLTQKDLARSSQVPLSTLNDVIRGRRNPTTVTVNKLLACLRRYEPAIRYEDVFA